jgi:NADH:ubiquinone oxidoreductase subunit D
MSTDTVASGRMTIGLGPFGLGVEGEVRIVLATTGERVRRAEVQLGYLHRGIERALTEIDWPEAIPLVARIDGRSSLAWEACWCEVIEGALEVEVPRRATTLRELAGALELAAASLECAAGTGAVAGARGWPTAAYQLARRVRAHLAAWSGRTRAHALFEPGGVRTEPSPEWLGGVLNLCTAARVQLEELTRALAEDAGFTERTSGLASISHQQGLDHAISGLVLRSPGDALSRTGARIDAAGTALEEAATLAQSLPRGVGTAPVDTARPLPVGEWHARREGVRGEVAVRLVGREEATPHRVRLRSPSMALLAAIPRVLEGCLLDDVELALVSLAPSISEADR